MKKNPQVGQRIIITGDSFELDPHELEIGSVHIIEAINPATDKENLSSMEELLLAMTGGEPFDIPVRVRVQFGPDFLDYANVPFEDFSIIEQGVELKVRMMEDDELDGFNKGEVYVATYEEDVCDYVFTDADGDQRVLSDHKHEVI